MSQGRNNTSEDSLNNVNLRRSTQSQLNSIQDSKNSQSYFM